MRKRETPRARPKQRSVMSTIRRFRVMLEVESSFLVSEVVEVVLEATSVARLRSSGRYCRVGDIVGCLWKGLGE